MTDPHATSAQTGGPALADDYVAWGALAAAVLVAGLTAAPAGSWLDAGEFIAAARTMGIVHPPGHPAWLSLAGLCELLPLGPHALRVAWFSSACAGISALLVVRIARILLSGVGNRGWQDAWATAAACALVGSATLWQVGNRAEVYTLALATNLWMVLAALRAGHAASAGLPHQGHLAAAAAALCLGLLNHHYVTLFAFPAAAAAAWPALALTARRHRRFFLALVLGCAWLGVAYMALWLRARTDVELRWGDPTTPAGLWDTVTARHFAGSVTAAQVDRVGNAMVLLAMVVDDGGTVLPLLGLLGVCLGVLRRGRGALMLVLALVLGLLTKALMQIDTHNPDDHGYILMAVAALALGLAQLGAVLAPVQPRRWLAGLLAAATLAALAAQVWTLSEDPTCNLAQLRAPEQLDSLARRAVAPGALVLPNYYGTQYAEAAFRLAEGRRPDWVVAHLSFRTGDTDHGRGFARWFQNAHPELAVLAQGAQALGRPVIGNILQLAEVQSVFAEPDPQNRIPEQYWGFDGLYQRLLGANERTLDYDAQQLRERQERIWQRWYARLSAADLRDHSTRMVLLWHHALQAAHALRRGWRDTARDELARARRVAPKDQLVGRLERRLAQLDEAWKRQDAKGFADLWKSWSGRDFDAMLGDD